MNRRAFLSLLAAGLASTADPECLLWQPDRKLISIPKPTLSLNLEDAWTWTGIPVWLAGDYVRTCDSWKGSLKMWKVVYRTPDRIKLIYK